MEHALTEPVNSGPVHPAPTRAERVATLAWLGAAGTLALGTLTYSAFFVIVSLYFPGRRASAPAYAIAAAPMLLGAAATWFAGKRYRASTRRGAPHS